MSRLRITGGSAGGRWLIAPIQKGVRPTSTRMREAIFSIIGQDLANLRFLDACSGSGIIAVEAWSRGAVVTAFEKDRRTASRIREGLDALDTSIDLRIQDATRIRSGEWDVAFVDPPYKLEPEPFLAALSGRVGTVHMEVDAKRSAPESVGVLRLVRARSFGDSALWTFEAGD